MPDPAELLVSLRGVERNYHGLRPLRVRSLDVRAGETVAILGMDREPAEAFVNLVSAATLPDVGEVMTLGQSTAAVQNNDDWVRLLERVGILSERAMLLGEMTTEQNLAMPFSLDLFELAPDLQERVNALAREVALPPDMMKVPTGGLSPLLRAKLRLARAVASDPAVLLAEHPNALVGEDQVEAFGEDIARVIAGRRMAAVVITANRSFARMVARSTLIHNPATGDLTPASLWRRWLS
ncbi:MAG: ATP-binding cassette domain-containing protein [Vicinamibacterales bacterium]